MADKASKFDPKEIADVAQNTLRKFTSLDTPQDMTAAETAADIAAGFVPGIGTAQSARDFERARRESDKLGMGLSAVGMVPVVGGVVKPAKVAARSLGDLVDQYVRRVRKMEELGPAGYSVHKVEAPASSEVPGWHISQDLPGILSTGAMTNKAVGANNIQGWVPAHVGGAYFYSDPRLARAKWEDLADVVGDPKLAAEMPVIRAQLRRGNRLVPDEDVSLSVPWQQSYQEGSFATKRPVLINQIDRIYSADPSVTKDMIRDTIIRQRRYAAGGAVDFEKGGKAEFDPKEIASVAEQTLKKFTSLDTPQNMSSAEAVADIAAGFVPGIGTAQSARDFERARREGDKLGMGLSAVGMIPVVGGVVKPARKGVAKLREVLAREAPEQAAPASEALLRTLQTGREHSVIGLANEGGKSVITRGTESTVLPNSFDLRAALRDPGRGPILDFHTHPGSGYSIFEAAPSRQDFSFYSSSYPDKRELRTLIATPPARAPNRGTAYNLFVTDAPKKTLDPVTLDAAKFELQRAGSKGQFRSIMDDPLFREYFEYGGDLGDLLADVSSLALQRYRAAQGAGRHEMQLSGKQITPNPEATDIELFRRLENPTQELLRSKKFAEGGAVADTDVKSWLAARPGATDYDIAAAMKKYDVAPEQVSRVTGIGLPEVQARYAVARPKTDEEVKQFLTSQPGMTDPQIANAMRMYNVAPEQVSRAINMGLPEVKLRYAFASPPPQPQPAPSGGRGDPMRDLNNIASAYSIGTYFIPGMQAAPLIDYGLRALSLGNTIKDIGKKLGFAAGGPVNYDPTEIDTIVSRVKEELHG